MQSESQTRVEIIHAGTDAERFPRPETVNRYNLDYTVKFVPNHSVPDYEILGWVKTSDLVGTHHGQYGTLMIWYWDPLHVLMPDEWYA